MYWNTDLLARRISQITILGFVLYGPVLPPILYVVSLHLRSKSTKVTSDNA
jgi:hypothetical protein